MPTATDDPALSPPDSPTCALRFCRTTCLFSLGSASMGPNMWNTTGTGRKKRATVRPTAALQRAVGLYKAPGMVKVQPRQCLASVPTKDWQNTSIRAHPPGWPHLAFALPAGPAARQMASARPQTRPPTHPPVKGRGVSRAALLGVGVIHIVRLEPPDEVACCVILQGRWKVHTSQQDWARGIAQSPP